MLNRIGTTPLVLALAAGDVAPEPAGDVAPAQADPPIAPKASVCSAAADPDSTSVNTALALVGSPPRSSEGNSVVSSPESLRESLQAARIREHLATPYALVPIRSEVANHSQPPKDRDHNSAALTGEAARTIREGVRGVAEARRATVQAPHLGSLAGIGVVGGLAQAGEGLEQLHNGELAQGAKNAGVGGALVGAGVAQVARLGGHVVPMVAAATSLVEGGWDVTHDHPIQGAAKVAGGAMLTAAPFLGPAGSAVAVVGTAVVAAAVAIPLLVEARPYEIPSEAEPPLPDPTSGAFIGP